MTGKKYEPVCKNGSVFSHEPRTDKHSKGKNYWGEGDFFFLGGGVLFVRRCFLQRKSFRRFYEKKNLKPNKNLEFEKQFNFGICQIILLGEMGTQLRPQSGISHLKDNTN